MKDFAIVMWGELRAIPTIIHNFNNNFVNSLNADVYVICQRTNTYIDDYFNNINHNVRHKSMYDKPNINFVYSRLSELGAQDNCVLPQCLNIFYNWNKINDDIGDLLSSQYKYIILTRSDYNHIVSFPNINNLVNDTNTNLIWTYDGSEYEGINMNLMVIPNYLIKNFLTCVNDALNNPNKYPIKDQNCNIEMLIKKIFDQNNWKIGKIDNNAFITCQNSSERTTWKQISFSQKYNVFYKYEDNLEKAQETLRRTKNNKCWKYIISDFPRIVYE